MRVFVSSTSLDLREHRQAALDALHRLGQVAIAMEYFGGVSGDGNGVSLDKMADSEAFIGLYAHRYGYRPNGGKSVTENEYDEAVRLKLPRFIFKIEPRYTHALIDAHRETDADSIRLLADFMARLSRDNVHAIFTNPDNLAMLVMQAIGNKDQMHPSTPPSPSIQASDFSGGVGHQFNNSTSYFGNTTPPTPKDKRRP